MHIARHRHRVVLLTLFVLAGTGVLLSRLHTYQIEDRESFLDKLPQDYEVVIREPGIRGVIVDRNGVELAKNQRNYEISFNLKEVHKAYLSDVKNNIAEEGLNDIDAIVNRYLRPKLQLKSEKNPEGLNIHLDRSEETIPGLKAHYNTHGGLIPFTFRNDLSYDEFAHAAENNITLPGVYINVRPQRQYPYGSLASHILGYVKPWAKGDVPEGYKHYVGDERGVNGVELTLDEYLRGTEGIQRILRNQKGKTLRMIDRTRHGSGAKVTLTIDAELQYLTEKVLRTVGRAAAVVIDPNTGEILAMASTPDYNPNDFIPSISPDTAKLYNSNKAQPFNNAAIQNFTPGSTFKLPTSLIGCWHNKGKFTHNCVGYIEYGKVKCRCWKTWGHGTLELSEAIQRSCNPYFMQMAAVVGSENLVNGMTKLGLGQKTGIRLPAESPGIIPGNQAWRRKNRNNRLTPAISGMTTIGQADSEATPLQMAMLVSAIANRGHLYQPRIVKSVDHPLQNVLIPNRPRLRLNLLREGINIEDLEAIRKGMWLAVNKSGGTAQKAALEEVEVAAKTGTAQTTDHGLKTNVSWTVGFAPFDSPKYVIAVAVRRGTSGGKVAAPLLNLILKGAFARDNGTYKIPIQPLSPAEGNFDIIDEIKIPKKNTLAVLFGPPADEPNEENSIILVHPEPEDEDQTNNT